MTPHSETIECRSHAPSGGSHGTLVRKKNMNSSHWGKENYFLILSELCPELHTMFLNLKVDFSCEESLCLLSFG